MGKIVATAALLVLGAAGTNPTQSDGFDGTLSGALTGPNGETLTNSPDGSWTIAADNGQQEDMSWDMSSTANQIDISSSTGVARVKYDSIGLQCVDLLVGASANFTDFSSSTAVISNADTALTNANEIGLMVETKADSGTTIAVNTLAMTRMGYPAYGGIFRAVVDGPTNTGDAIGLLTKSQDVHTNGDNYGLRTLATGGVNNWSNHNDGGIWALNGQILTIDSSSTEEMQMFDNGGDWTLSNLLNNATGDEVAITLSYTVNKSTSGSDTGLLINMTDTASPGTSRIFECQKDSGSVFTVFPTGNTTTTGNATAANMYATTSIGFPGSTKAIAPLNGKLRITNWASSTGVTWLYTTADQATLRNLADDGDGLLNLGSLVASGDITSTDTGDVGWSVQTGADTACSTTCTSACGFGQDTGTGNIVDCSDATADRCLCLGAS